MIRLRTLAWILASLGFLTACVIQFAGHTPLQTNILALLPPTERNPVAEQSVASLAKLAGNRAVFLVGYRDAAAAEQAARHFALALRQSGAFRHVQTDVPAIAPKRLVDFYLPYRFGLLTDTDREALERGHADLKQRLVRKLYAPFRLGPGIPLAEDPFGLLGDWFGSLAYGGSRLEPANGLLIARTRDKAFVLVSAELRGSAYDGTVQRSVIQAVAAAQASLAGKRPGAEILRSGPVFFAAAARKTAQSEMDLIGAGSLLGIALLLAWVFRSIRPFALGILSVAIGICAATAITVAIFGKLNLLTLVFGASLIGEAIDYSIQYFAAYVNSEKQWEPWNGLRLVLPALTVALSTSLLGYAAIMFSPFPAMHQIALFAMVGLAAAYLSVTLLLPALLPRPYGGSSARVAALPAKLLRQWGTRVTPTAGFVLVSAAVLAAIPGWLLLHSDDNVRTLITLSPALSRQETQIRNLTGIGNSSQFFLVEGSSPDAVLEREEALTARLRELEAKGVLSRYQAVSTFVPSAVRQKKDFALLGSKIFSDPARLQAILAAQGLSKGAIAGLIAAYHHERGKVLGVENWLESPLSAPFRHLWLGRTMHGFASVVMPQGFRSVAPLQRSAQGLAGVTLVDKVGSVSRLFHTYRQAGEVILGVALILVYLVLAFRYGWRAGGLVLLPTLLAMGLALSVFGYLGTPITLFNVMGLMLVLGVGVNYAIFLYEGCKRAATTLAGVLLSAATTILSFGLLSFSSTPALSSIGLTLLVGISVALLFAPLALGFQEKQ